MFMEATIILLVVMLTLWAAAIWASYKEDPGTKRPTSVEDGFVEKNRYKKGA